MEHVDRACSEKTRLFRLAKSTSASLQLRTIFTTAYTESDEPYSDYLQFLCRVRNLQHYLYVRIIYNGQACALIHSDITSTARSHVGLTWPRTYTYGDVLGRYVQLLTITLSEHISSNAVLFETLPPRRLD